MAKGDGVLFFDLETHNAGRQYEMPAREFFRLGQYAWDRDGEVHLTTDYDEMVSLVRSARLVVGHNIHSFDLSVLFGPDSTEPLEMALAGRVLDTFTWASVAMPAPDVWTDENGAQIFTCRGRQVNIGIILKWLSLNNLNTQLGIPTKTGHLRDIAKRYNPPGTLVKALDYGLIPLDDPEFVAYAIQDVHAVRALATRLLDFPGGVTPYIWREQKFAAICAQNSRNGWLVDIDRASARVAELADKRHAIMSTVVAKYGLPTEGKAPWRTTDGKAAIFAALSDFGIAPELVDNWPLTDTGNPSLGGDALKMLTEGTPAEDLGTALAELMGQRPLAQQALDHVYPDNKVHPSITTLQRSGRVSTTEPGLTTWSARGPGAKEKEYFIAAPGCKLVEFDYSNADARVVAAYSGDAEYAKRFEDGIDAHELTGRMVYADEEYDKDPNRLRQEAKMMTHAYSYGARPKTLALQTGLPIETTTLFCERMDEMYSGVVKWQRDSSKQGDTGFITNDWGRRMVVSSGRSFTQSSALLGQSGTRELMVDGLISLAEQSVDYIRMLKAQVHDAIVMEIPESGVDKTVATVIESMSTSWKPQHGGQRVEFILSYGNPATDWYLAGH